MGRQEYGASRGAGVLAAALVIAGLAIGLHSARAQQPGFNYLRQGDLMMKAGRNDDAIRIFTAGKQRNTAQELIYRKRIIEAMMRLGKRSAGEEMGEQILKEHPRDADALGLRAMFLIDAGKAQDAIKILGVPISAYSGVIRRSGSTKRQPRCGRITRRQHRHTQI
jgi:tetratricopeptide (TPR) repeat protein